jgi:hypothetical protein
LTFRLTLLSCLRDERSVGFIEHAHAATRRIIAEQMTVPNRSRSFSRVNWCKESTRWAPRLPTEFTSSSHTYLLLWRFFRHSMGVLLTLRGSVLTLDLKICSLFTLITTSSMA